MSNSHGCKGKPQRIVAIDTDPGVDDALALMLAFRSPEIQIPLITTVAGNVPVNVGTVNLGRLLKLISPPIWPAVAQGAALPLKLPLITAEHVHGDDGLGGATSLVSRSGQARYPHPGDFQISKDAPGRLIALAKRHGRDLCIVALGPLTNIARALLRDVESMLSIGRLIVMGGAIDTPGNVTPGAEFNIHVDPDAASIVLSSGIDITLVPLDVTRQVTIDATMLRSAPNTALTRAIKAFTRVNRESGRDIFMHDPLALAVAIEPTLVTTESLVVEVETQGKHTLGMTLADRRPAGEYSSTPPIDVATRVNAPAVLALFRQRVMSTRAKTSPIDKPGAVLVVGSANIDLSVTLPTLPKPGETVLGPSSLRQFGGKGANQAIAARRAGSQVALVAKVGSDSFGHDYQQFLVDEGIDIHGVTRASDQATGLALIAVDSKGENQIAVASGANRLLAPGDLPIFSRANAKVLVAQLECPLKTVASALRRARKAGLITVLNTAPAKPLPEDMLRDTDVLIANEVEAQVLCGLMVTNLKAAAEAGRAIQNKGVNNVVVTCGKRGAVWIDGKGRTHRVKAQRVKTVDTTGAGDTFVGYFASALARGDSLRHAIEYATRAAAISVTRPGATSSIPNWRDVG